jgi:hypothetical protein
VLVADGANFAEAHMPTIVSLSSTVVIFLKKIDLEELREMYILHIFNIAYYDGITCT